MIWVWWIANFLAAALGGWLGAEIVDAYYQRKYRKWEEKYGQLTQYRRSK